MLINHLKNNHLPFNNKERVKTFDEQYPEIQRMLQEDKRNHFEREFVKDLRADAVIMYL